MKPYLITILLLLALNYAGSQLHSHGFEYWWVCGVLMFMVAGIPIYWKVAERKVKRNEL